MQFSSSLKLNHIFRRLYRKGQSAANGYLVLYCHKNGSRQNRIGLTVSAKLAHAVHRNRLRRQLREIYRLHEAQFARGYDDVAAVTVLRSMKYKKRSIAFMKKVLDTYKVPNTLSQFLSNASHYKVPTFNKLAR